MPEYRRIDFSQLHKADIIFTTSRYANISIAIRKATNSLISHTMLVTKSGWIIDSTEKGVQERSWAGDAENDVTLAIVMRRDGLSRGEDQDKVVVVARSFENRSYDHIGAVGSGMHGSTSNKILAGAGCALIGLPNCALTAKAIQENAKDENADKMFFCSELVSRSFSKAGFPIVNGRATDQTPQMVYTSTYLRYVGHLIDIPPLPVDKEKERERNRRAGYRKDS